MRTTKRVFTTPTTTVESSTRRRIRKNTYVPPVKVEPTRKANMTSSDPSEKPKDNPAATLPYEEKTVGDGTAHVTEKPKDNPLATVEYEEKTVDDDADEKSDKFER